MKKFNLERYKTLSERYTKALLQSAKDNNNVDKVADELKQVVDTITTNPDIDKFFSNPIIGKADKKDILDKSFKEHIQDNLYNFLNILIDKNRMFILPNIEYLYKQTLEDQKNILNVEVETCINLDDNMELLLREKLGKMTGKTIQIKNKINSDIIGGVILKYDGKVIDGSIKTQLKRLQKQLI